MGAVADDRVKQEPQETAKHSGPYVAGVEDRKQ